MEVNPQDYGKAFSIDGASTLTSPLPPICCIHFREHLIKKLKYHEKTSFCPEELCNPLVTDSRLMKWEIFSPRFLILCLAVVVAFNQCIIGKQPHPDLITPLPFCGVLKEQQGHRLINLVFSVFWVGEERK